MIPVIFHGSSGRMNLVLRLHKPFVLFSNNLFPFHTLIHTFSLCPAVLLILLP